MGYPLRNDHISPTVQKALLSRGFSGFLRVGYVSSLEDNRFFSQLKIDDNEFHVMSFL